MAQRVTSGVLAPRRYATPGLLLVLLMVASLAVRLVRLDSPPIPLFDEGLFYLPAARSYLAGLPDPNFEHPPLAKLSIAAGIALLGDTP